MLCYNESSNKSSCRIGNWVEEEKLREITGHSRYCQTDVNTFLRTIAQTNDSKISTKTKTTITQKPKQQCPKKQALKDQFKQIALQQLSNQQRENEEKLEKDTKQSVKIVKREKLLPRVPCSVPLPCHYRKHALFTNDPTLVPEKEFLEEDLSNENYKFFQLIAFLNSTEITQPEKKQIEQKIMFKYGIDISLAKEKAQLELKNNNFTKTDFESLKEFFSKSDSLSQVEGHIVAYLFSTVKN